MNNEKSILEMDLAISDSSDSPERVEEDNSHLQETENKCEAGNRSGNKLDTSYASVAGSRNSEFDSHVNSLMERIKTRQELSGDLEDTSQSSSLTNTSNVSYSSQVSSKEMDPTYQKLSELKLHVFSDSSISSESLRTINFSTDSNLVSTSVSEGLKSESSSDTEGSPLPSSKGISQGEIENVSGAHDEDTMPMDEADGETSCSSKLSFVLKKEDQTVPKRKRASSLSPSSDIADSASTSGHITDTKRLKKVRRHSEDKINASERKTHKRCASEPGYLEPVKKMKLEETSEETTSEVTDTESSDNGNQ